MKKNLLIKNKSSFNKLFTLFTVMIGFISFNVKAQDMQVSPITYPPSIEVGDTGILEVVIINNSWTTDMPAGQMRLHVYFDSALTAYAKFPNTPTLADGFAYNPKNYSMDSNTTNSIWVTNTQVLPNSWVDTIHFRMVGLSPGWVDYIHTVLSYNTPPTLNLLVNDSATTSITVTMPLPVTLLSFTASVNNCDININWQSGIESDFSKYVIERSDDGRSFEKIGEVASRGSGMNYSYADKELENGKYFYRLQLLDDNGDYEYSNVLSVTKNCNNKIISLYPNPVKDYATIIGLENGDVIFVHDVKGSLILKKVATSENTQIDFNQLITGSYQVMVYRKGNAVAAFKVVNQQ